jgi:hypothetical protein
MRPVPRGPYAHLPAVPDFRLTSSIPVGVTALGLGAGEAASSLPAGRHITNDGGLRRYLGAAPPPGPAHHYYIVVTALDVPTTGVPDTANPALALFQTLKYVVGAGPTGAPLLHLSDPILHRSRLGSSP